MRNLSIDLVNHRNRLPKTRGIENGKYFLTSKMLLAIPVIGIGI
jgi:hypothetical protein